MISDAIDPFIVGIIIGLVCTSPFFLRALKNTKFRRRVQKRMQNEHNVKYKEGKWFAVRFSSEARFAQFWKIIPWNYAGMVHIDNNGIDFYGENISGNSIVVHFKRENSNAEWTGLNFKNGNIYWFVIIQDGIRYYFTSETGTWVFGSLKSTKVIFNEANRVLVQQ